MIPHKLNRPQCLVALSAVLRIEFLFRTKSYSESRSFARVVVCRAQLVVVVVHVCDGGKEDPRGHFIRGKGETVSYSGGFASGSSETPSQHLYLPVDVCWSMSAPLRLVITHWRMDAVYVCRACTAKHPHTENNQSKDADRSSRLPLR